MDLASCKNDKARALYIRDELNRLIAEYLKIELGADKVIHLDKAITTSNDISFSKGDILVNVGTTTNRDGYEVEPIAKISAISVSWNDTAKRKAVTFGDILDCFDDDS